MLPFLHRRDFLKGSAALAGAGLLGTSADAAPDAPPPASSGANSRLNVAVIGVRGRGMDHIAGFAGRNNCVVTHVCDADSGVIGPATQRAAKAQGSTPRYVQDLRRIMDDKSIHIVSIATPNHWHSLAAIWAMQAGKDVYVEKPVSHNVSEGRRVVEVARHTNKICQTGTQIRSSQGVADGLKFLNSGKLGKLQVARRCATSAGPASARPRAISPFRRPLITTCGAGLRRAIRYVVPTCTTIGTGNGTPATAISATRVSTKWTSPAGD